MATAAFSLRRLDDVLPDRFVAWVRWACVVAVVGYGAVVAMDLTGMRAQEPMGLVGEALALVTALVALWLVLRERAGTAALLLMLAVGAEIHWAIFLDGNLGRGGALVVPVLLLAGGALLGGRGPYVLAGAGMVTLPAAVLLGGMRRGDAVGALREQLSHLVILAAVLLATSVLLYLALRAFEEVLALAQARAQRVADLIRHAPDAILVLDRQELVKVANPAAERLFRRTADQLHGCSIHELGLTPAPDTGGEDETPLDALDRILQGAARPLLLALDPDPSGPGRTALVEATSRHTEGGEPRLQILFRDVTERVEARAEQRELELRLQQAHRLQAVAVLAGGVAHEFNNLFTVVRGVGELLRLEGDPGLQEPAADLARVQERGALLTRKLLTFARRDEVAPEVVALQDVVEEVAPFLKSVAGDAVEMALHLDDPGLVVVDPTQVDQLLSHLVANARDAGARRVVLSVRTRKSEVHLAVEDDGRGMEPRVRERMFDPFFSTKPLGAGSGLSLASVLGIVERHQGRVDVETAPGRGTSITVRLPRAPGVEETAPALGSSRLEG